MGSHVGCGGLAAMRRAPIPLSRGFENAPGILAMGGEIKATFCLVKDG